MTLINAPRPISSPISLISGVVDTKCIVKAANIKINPDVKIVVMDVLSAFFSDSTLLYFFLKLTYLSVNNIP